MRRLSYEDLLEFWDLHRAPRNRLIWCRTQMQNMKALLTRSHRTRIVVHHFWVQRIALLVVQNEPGEWERGATFTAHNWSLPNRGFCVRIFLRLTAFPESVHYVHLRFAVNSKRAGIWETRWVSEGRYSEGAEFGLQVGGAEALAFLFDLGHQFAFRLGFSVEHFGVAVSGAQAHQRCHAD